MPDFYGTAAGFRIYHGARGNQIPAEAADDEYVAARLLKASEWLDARYRSSFPGLKVGGRSQVREWERTGAIDTFGYTIRSDTIPTEVENATYEAALKDMDNPGILSVDWTPPKYKSASITGAVSVVYQSFGSVGDVQTHFAIVGQILAPILSGCGATSSLSGSLVRT